MSDKASAFDEKNVHDSGSVKPEVRDVFGDEDDAAIKYKTMTWQVGVFVRVSVGFPNRLHYVVRCLVHDCGDREQWNAFIAFGPGSGRWVC